MIGKGGYRWLSRLILAPGARTDGATPETSLEPGGTSGGKLVGAQKRLSLWRIALLTFALLLPALANGSALPFPDSVSYIKGGAFALEKLGALLGDLLPSSTAAGEDGAGNGPLIAAEADANNTIAAMRSPTYSVYAYLTSLLAKNGFFIVAGQAAMVAFTVTLFLRAFAPALSAREYGATVLILALLSAAPWYGSFAMPDILGAASVLSMVLYFVYLDRLNLIEKLTLAAITAFAITAHPGNVLLVAALAGLGGLERITRDLRANRPFAFTTYGWAAAPLALGVGTILMISLVGFGEASVAPKRYPFALARSVTDGPGRWHLEKHCDTYHYAVCEVFDEIPIGVGEFLWEETGLRYRATPEQLDRIRAEEMTIVARAAREYPMAQIRKAMRNTYEQIIRVGVPAIGLGQKLQRGDDGAWHISESAPKFNGLIKYAEMLQISVIYLSLIMLAYLVFWRKSTNINQRRVIALIAAALFANAVICGVLSGPADRYQGRLIWLLPLVTAVLAATHKPWNTSKINA